MSYSEAMLKEDWINIEKKVKCLGKKPPAVSVETETLDDVYEWGAWVTQKGNITPMMSQELLGKVREYLESK